MALVSYLTDPLSPSSGDTLSSSVGDTYLDPDFADLQFDTVPPELDEATVDRLAKEEFDSRFGRFGGKQPPPWFPTEKSGKGGSMAEWLDNSGADPETRLKTFETWFQDYRDWHIMQGLMDANTQKLFTERVRPHYDYLRNTAAKSKTEKAAASKLQWARDLIEKEDVKVYGLPSGKALTATSEQLGGLIPEEGKSLLPDVSNASTRGLINRASSDTAKVVASVAELAEDAHTYFALPDQYEQIMRGDKLTLDTLENEYKRLRGQGTKEENAFYMDKLVKVRNLREMTKGGSTPIERFDALNTLAAGSPRGEQMEGFEHFSREGTTLEKAASTLYATPELFAESMSQSADVLAASFVGSLFGGPAGAGILAGAFSYNMDQAAEFSGLVQEEITRRAQESKVNPTDRKAMLDISKGVFRDSTFIQGAKDAAGKHAAPVAALDAAAAVVGGGAFRRFGKLGSLAGAAAVDPVLGMGGEALGQAWSYGSLKDVSGIFAEASGAPTSFVAAAADNFKYWQNDSQLTETTTAPAPPSPETKKRSLREKLAAESGKAKKGRVTPAAKITAETTPEDLFTETLDRIRNAEAEKPAEETPTPERRENISKIIDDEREAQRFHDIVRIVEEQEAQRTTDEPTRTAAGREARFTPGPVVDREATPVPPSPVPAAPTPVPTPTEPTPEAAAAGAEASRSITEEKKEAEAPPTPDRIARAIQRLEERRRGDRMKMSMNPIGPAFRDLESVVLGATQAAINLYGKAKDFASWSAGLVQQFGEKIQPYLKSLWNKINYAVDFFTPIGNTERGNIINPFQSTEKSKPENKVRDVIVRKLKDTKGTDKRITETIDNTSTRFLSPDDQKKLLKLSADYVAGKKGKGIGLPEEVVLREFQQLKAKSDQAEFDHYKKQNPTLLGNKTLSDFGGSIRSVRGFLTRSPDAKGIHRAPSPEKREEMKSARMEKMRNNIRLQYDQINDYLDSEEFENLTDQQKVTVEAAIEALIELDLDVFDQPGLADIQTAINNLVNDHDIISLGRYITTRAKEESVGRFKDAIRAAGGDPDSIFGVPAGSTKNLLKFQAGVDKIVHMTRSAFEAWVKMYAPLDRGLAKADLLYRRLSSIHDLSMKRLKSGFKNLELPLRRIQVVAMLSQWRDKVGVQDILDTYQGLLTGQETLNGATDKYLKIEALQYAKAMSQIARDAPIEFDEDGNAVTDLSAEELADFFESQLTEKEMGYLNEMREEFAKLQADSKFVKEFWVGEEFDPWVNYFPRLAKKALTKKVDAVSGDLEDSGYRTIDEETGRPLETTEGTLKDRSKIAKGQYYELNAFNVVDKGFKQSSYDINTWGERSALKKTFTDKDFIDAVGEERADALHNSVKGVHYGYSSAGGLTDSLGGAVFDWAVNTTIVKMMSSIAGIPKQLFAPLMGAAAGYLVRGDIGIFIRSFADYIISAGETNKWIEQVSPEIYHRFEQENPALDHLKSGSKLQKAVKSLASLPMHELSSGQQAMKLLFGGVPKVGAVFRYFPEQLTKWMQQKPDATTARIIFRAEYINALINRGVIGSYDEFNPSLPIDAESAYIAKSNTENWINSPSANRYRANLFNSPDSVHRAWANVYKLAQTTLYSAGDRMNDMRVVFGDYNQENKPTNEALAFMTGNIVQSIFFVSFGMMVNNLVTSGAIVNTIAAALHRREEEDKEKKGKVSINRRTGRPRFEPADKSHEEKFEEYLNKEIALKDRVLSSGELMSQEILKSMISTFIPQANNPLIVGALVNNGMAWADSGLTAQWHKDTVKKIDAMLEKGGLTKKEKEILEFDKAYHNEILKRQNRASHEQLVDAGGYGFVDTEVTRLGDVKWTPQGITGQLLSMQSTDIAKAYRVFQKAEKKFEQGKEREKRTEEVKEMVKKLRSGELEPIPVSVD